MSRFLSLAGAVAIAFGIVGIAVKVATLASWYQPDKLYRGSDVSASINGISPFLWVLIAGLLALLIGALIQFDRAD